MTLELIIIGSGTAFDHSENYQSNLAVRFGDRFLALDYGTTAPAAWEALGLDPFKIMGVYVSHGHFDHRGGLEHLGFMRYFTQNPVVPNLFFHESLGGRTLGEDGPLWESMKMGMASLQCKDAFLRTYFMPAPVKDNSKFVLLEEGVAKVALELEPIQMIHVYNRSVFMPTYGLMMTVTKTGKKVLWTSDTQFAPAQLRQFYELADLIIHDCEIIPGFRSGVHAHIEDLSTLPMEVKRKMWLIHYQTKFLGQYNIQELGFAGLVVPGQTFNLLEL